MARRVKKSRAAKAAPKKKTKTAPAPSKKRRKASGSSTGKTRGASKPRSSTDNRRRSASKLTPQQKAARTRKRNAAELERKKLARRESARRRREELESIRLSELERKRTRRKRGKRTEADERELLIDVLEEMRNKAAELYPTSLEITEAEVGARIPWLVVGRFDLVEAIGYAELDEVFRYWESDLLLEARIHPQRLSQIRIVYSDPNAKRGESDSIVAHTGPWESVISETAAELDPSDEDSLAARYENTTVPHFYVYFSGQLASEAEISL